MKKTLFFLLVLISFYFPGHSQIRVGSNNSIGIGTENPVSKLSVGNVGSSSSKVYFENTPMSDAVIRTLHVYQPAPSSSNTWTFTVQSLIDVTGSSNRYVGFQGQAKATVPQGSGRTYGGRMIAGNASSGYNYGLYAAIDGSNNGAAIFGTIPGRYDINVGGMFAAYLRGNVFIEDNLGVGKSNPTYKIDAAGDIKTSGTLHCYAINVTSDATKKENIRSLDKGNLQKLSNLNAVSFTYKAPRKQRWKCPNFRIQARSL